MARLFMLLAIFFQLIYAMSDDEIKEYMARNSLNLQAFTSNPSKIYPSNPTLLHLLYVIAPEMISGSNFEWNKYEKPYIMPQVLNQPVVGGFFGQGKIPNAEMLLKLDPDLILVNQNLKNQKQLKEFFGSVLKPMLYLNLSSLQDYIDAFRILGFIVGKKERADEVIEYSKKSLELTSRIDEYIKSKNLKKPTIYYAQGEDGLQTECEGSAHAALIELSGAKNIHKCSEKSSEFGRVKISFEQLLMYQPDMILAYEDEFFKFAKSDKKWQLLNAVKNNKIYLIPREPFSWFDRPPSFMRFLGIKWLIDINYPNAFKFDMKKETKEFYKLFLRLDLNDKQIKHILGKNE